MTSPGPSQSGRPRLRMRDYLGRLVILVRDVTRRDGQIVRRGRGLTVASHWRGRLTLADPATGQIVLRHIHRRGVCLVTGHEWWRQAQPAQPTLFDPVDEEPRP